MVVNWLKLLRPKHWVKNLLLGAPMVFSFAYTAENVARLAAAFVAFCALSSAVYIVNDIADRESDRHHPKKRKRPIAAGRISVKAATMAAMGLAVAGLIVAGVASIKVLVVAMIYVLMNLAYSSRLKHVPILDVMLVALGFVLRVMAGAYAIRVPLSHWILLCTFFGALFIAFGKRKNEMGLPEEEKKRHRKSASEYTDRFIDQMLALSAGIAVVFYAFYTIDPEVVKRFGSQRLVYTTPIVVFGVLRYYYLLYNRDEGGDPVALALEDRPLILCLLVWLASVIFIYLYGNHRLFS